MKNKKTCFYKDYLDIWNKIADVYKYYKLNYSNDTDNTVLIDHEINELKTRILYEYIDYMIKKYKPYDKGFKFVLRNETIYKNLLSYQYQRKIGNIGSKLVNK